MNRVIYFAMTSADGFIEDRRGSIEFHTPDAAVHAFINERHGTIRSMVLDARDYGIMQWWDSPAAEATDEAQEVLAYTRLWKQMKKYLIAPAKPADLPQEYQYREFLEPDQLRLWLSAGLGDMMVSAGLAGVCAREGLLDEVWLMVVPVCLGAGLPVSIGEEVGLRLEESLRFENVWLFNRYEVEQ